MPTVEVDQSGKIERTHTDTFLAFSDSLHYVICIPARVKRAGRATLRSKWRRRKGKKSIYIRLFAVGLFLLLKDHLADLGQVVIDIEYTGRESDIKGMLLELIRCIEPDYPAERITFRRIGKKSSAHNLAWETHRGKRKPDHTVTEEEILNLL
ncbi:MAG: hypothetical protein ACE5MB_01050 [Anaerolineae bacterium]